MTVLLFVVAIVVVVCGATAVTLLCAYHALAVLRRGYLVAWRVDWLVTRPPKY